MTTWLMMLKVLIKSSLDNYVLPGTLTGTQILWLYMIQWKREISFLTFALLYFVSAPLSMTPVGKVISRVAQRRTIE